MFCPKKLCQVLFSGTDSPSLKMFFRKFAEDVLSKDCFVPMAVLSQRCLITKFLERKIHRTFPFGDVSSGYRVSGFYLFLYARQEALI
jgi:hypothetical protein